MYGFNKPVNTFIMSHNLYHSNEKLTYTSEGNLVDSKGAEVMMGWESGIMKHQATTIAKNRGDILNVGFGLGLIDNYIQSFNPKTHTIIESNKDVQKKMIDDGWLEKPNVTLIFKSWQDVLNDLPKFDGVFYDCWLDDQKPFDENIKNILKPGGIYSFFNNPNNGVINNIAINSYNVLSEFCNITSTSINIDNIDIKKHNYWDLDNKTYWIPECRLKKT